MKTFKQFNESINSDIDPYGEEDWVGNEIDLSEEDIDQQLIRLEEIIRSKFYICRILFHFTEIIDIDDTKIEGETELETESCEISLNEDGELIMKTIFWRWEDEWHPNIVYYHIDRRYPIEFSDGTIVKL